MKDKRNDQLDRLVLIAIGCIVIVIVVMAFSINVSIERIDSIWTDIQQLREVDTAKQVFLHYEHELEQMEAKIHNLAIDIYQSCREVLWESGTYDADQMMAETAKYSRICESSSLDEINITISKMFEEHPGLCTQEVEYMYRQLTELEASFRQVQQNYNSAYNKYQSVLSEYQDTINKYQYRRIMDYIY